MDRFIRKYNLDAMRMKAKPYLKKAIFQEIITTATLNSTNAVTAFEFFTTATRTRIVTTNLLFDAHRLNFWWIGLIY